MKSFRKHFSLHLPSLKKIKRDRKLKKAASKLKKQNSDSISLSYGVGSLSPRALDSDLESSVDSVKPQQSIGIQSLPQSTLFHICEYMPRMDHFTILTKVSSQFNELLSLRNYFSAMRPMNDAMFARDLAYFQSNVLPLMSKDKKEITLGDSIIKATNNQSLSIKFYLTHYESFLKLQRRFNRTRLSAQQSHVFPALFRTVIIDTQCINTQAMQFVSSIMELSSAQSPIKDWRMEDCQMTDSHLTSLCDALQRRQHFTPITKMDLSRNVDISDDVSILLFATMGQRCPKLMELDVSYTAISDKTCPIIGDYFVNYVDFSRKGAVPNIVWKFTKVTAMGEKLFTSYLSASFAPKV